MAEILILLNCYTTYLFLIIALSINLLSLGLTDLTKKSKTVFCYAVHTTENEEKCRSSRYKRKYKLKYTVCSFYLIGS